MYSPLQYSTTMYSITSLTVWFSKTKRETLTARYSPSTELQSIACSQHNHSRQAEPRVYTSPRSIKPSSPESEAGGARAAPSWPRRLGLPSRPLAVGAIVAQALG